MKQKLDWKSWRKRTHIADYRPWSQGHTDGIFQGNICLEPNILYNILYNQLRTLYSPDNTESLFIDILCCQILSRIFGANEICFILVWNWPLSSQTSTNLCAKCLCPKGRPSVLFTYTNWPSLQRDVNCKQTICVFFFSVGPLPVDSSEPKSAEFSLAVEINYFPLVFYSI